MRFAIGVILMAIPLSGCAAKTAPVATAKRPVTNVYHGVSVVDDYQWLENFDDPQVRKWNDAQNAAARAYFSKLASKPIIAKRLKELYSATSADYFGLQYRRGGVFSCAGQAAPPPPR